MKRRLHAGGGERRDDGSEPRSPVAATMDRAVHDRSVTGPVGTTSKAPWQRRLLLLLCPLECAPSKVQVLWKLSRTMSCWLAAVQVLMLAISIGLSEGFAPTSLNPMLGPYPTVLNTLGAKNAALITYRGELWRLLTPMLLHAGVVHLVINVVIQLRVGVLLELQWGLARFACIYIASGITSSVLSCLALPNALGVGSSGALMGLFGAWVVDIVCKWPAANSGEDTSQRAGQLFIVVFNIFITMMFSFVRISLSFSLPLPYIYDSCG